ncbi:hypothetical protein MMC2321_03593 [Chitinophaga sp. MM2321]
MLIAVLGNTYARAQQKFTFSYTNTSMEKILTAMEEKSGCKFLYNPRLLPTGPVTLRARKVSLPHALDMLLGDSLAYRILDNKLIVIAAVGSRSVMQSVSGTVVNEEEQPVVGATVHEQGAETGVITDEKGMFNLLVTANGALGISHVGYNHKTILIEGKQQLHIVLEEQYKELQEVMVTALGIQKEARSIGYAVQEVKVSGTEMVKAREPNAYSALYGKVAGLAVQNSRYLYNNPQLYLRGKVPLIVVDGVPVNSDSWDLNIDDVESIVVLKGAAAAALYGQAGAMGAVQIISKRGSNNKRGFEVEINSTTELQKGAIAIPHAQYNYGPGDYFKYAFVDGKGGGIFDYDYNIWGPRLEGQLITQWNSPRDANGNLVPLPWEVKNKDNLGDFLQTGMLATNNIAVSGRNEQGDFRLSVTQLNQRGTLPNTRLGITTMQMSGGYKLGKKARVDAQFTYNKQYAPNYPSIAYGPESPIYGLLIWSGSNFDINDPELKNYWYPGMEGLQQRWVEYTRYNNPWFNANEYKKAFYKDVLTGYASLSYNLNKYLDVQVKSAFNIYFTNQNTNYPVSGLYYGVDFYKNGAYAESSNRYSQQNNSVLLNFHRQLPAGFAMKLSMGGNIQTIRFQSSDAHTSGGLLIPGVYTLQNSAKQIDNATSYRAVKQVASVFGYADFSYKNVLFLDITGRADRNSSMPIDHNTYFYPQASMSAVISDMVSLPKPISFLKLSASVAKVGEGISSTALNRDYSLVPTYDKGNTWLGNRSVNYAIDNVLYNKDIRPEFHTAFETGMDIRFFNQRLGLSAQAYRSVDGPQIFSLSISNASGFGYRKVNGLVTERRGLELNLAGALVKTKTFTWDMVMNWSSNITYLKEVYDTMDSYQRVKIGERFDQIYINPFERNPTTGAMLYHSNGTPIVNDQVYKFWGYADPDWMLGTTQTIAYKDISLTLEFDGSFGGKIFNYLNYKMWQSGTNPASDNEYRYQDWLHRDDPGYKGTRVGVGDIVTSGEVKYDQQGKIISDTRTFAPNTMPVLEENWANSYETADERKYRSKTYFKLRGITLTYRFPEKLLRRVKEVHAASVSLVTRNVMYFAQLKEIDLDHWAYNSESELEEPSMRSIGINLNIKF